MNNEQPVAWIDPKELDMTVSTSVTKNKQFESDIPLYTHPAKPLGNVVVVSATCSCGKVMEVTNLQEAKTLTDEKIEVYKEALEKLARLGNGDEYGNSIGNDIAIDALRKAQE